MRLLSAIPLLLLSMAAIPDALAGDRPGLGRSLEHPVGKVFALPAGLELVQPVKGYSAFEYEKCGEQDYRKLRGSGNMVQLCLLFRNTTRSSISVTFPPGLIFIARSLKVQNGLLVISTTIEVPAGQTLYVPLALYCANSNGGRKPSTPDDDFELGPILEYADFQKLFGRLAGRNLNEWDTGPIQAAVWDLAMGEPLDPDLESKLGRTGPPDM